MVLGRRVLLDREIGVIVEEESSKVNMTAGIKVNMTVGIKVIKSSMYTKGISVIMLSVFIESWRCLLFCGMCPTLHILLA